MGARVVDGGRVVFAEMVSSAQISKALADGHISKSSDVDLIKAIEEAIKAHNSKPAFLTLAAGPQGEQTK